MKLLSLILLFVSTELFAAVPPLVTDTFAELTDDVLLIGGLLLAVTCVSLSITYLLRMIGGRLSRQDDPNERKPTGESFTFGGK